MFEISGHQRNANENIDDKPCFPMVLGTRTRNSEQMLEWLEAALWPYFLMKEITVVNQLGKKLIMWTHRDTFYTCKYIYICVYAHTYYSYRSLCFSTQLSETKLEYRN